MTFFLCVCVCVYLYRYKCGLRVYSPFKGVVLSSPGDCVMNQLMIVM